jgi:TP901 family phage tail tape measure protein
MATAFNLTAQINLRGPSNVRNIVSDIRRQLGTITGDVNLRINPATTRGVTALNSALTTLNNNLTATTNNATNAANAIRQFGAAVANIGNSTTGLNRNLNNAAAAANNAANNIGNTASQTRAASGEMVEFGRTAGLAVRRFAAFSMSAGAIMGLTNAIRQGIDAFIEYDKQFVKLQQVTGESASGLSQLSNTITGLSTSLGVSSTELTNISLTLAQAGLTARDTERALKALALSSLAPSFDNMNQTVEGSIALMRQFGISAADLEKSLGAVNAVSAKFAVEASDIIAAIQRTGGVFASASKGVSEGTDALNEFIAVFTSVRATTRESAETIATGLRTIFTRIQRGGTIEALKEFGVTLTDAEGKFVGAYKAVQLLSEGLNRIDPRDLKFSQIVEELGGFRQIGKVIPLIQQFATAQQALAVAQAGQTSLTEDAVTAQLSLANQAAKVREEFLALFREIGGSDTFQALAKGALSLASALISVADSVKGVLPVLAIMTAFRGASAIRQFGSGFARGFRTNAAQGAKRGGFIKKYAMGGDVPMADVALMPGEAVIFPEQAKRIGTSTLRRMNYADKRQKRAGGGKIGMVPGQGNSDSFYTQLPVGSFVIRKNATKAMGPQFIQDVASGRQKFAQGGLANIRSSKPYVRFNDITFDKNSGDNIKSALNRSQQKLRFNTRDKISANISRKQVDINKLKLSEQDKQLYNSPSSASNRGDIFEMLISKAGLFKQEQRSRFSRIDGSRLGVPVEVKSTKEQVSTNDLLDKLAGAIIGEATSTDRIIARKAAQTQLNNQPNIIDAGSLLVLEDKTALMGKPLAQKDIEKKEKQRFIEKARIKKQQALTQGKYTGGYVQRLMAGQFVKKGKGGRRATVRMNDWTLDEIASIPSAQLPSQLGISITDILQSAGSVSGNTAMSANDIRTLLGPYSKNPELKSKILSSLVVKANKIIKDRRDKAGEATNDAIASNSLFGAIGMFGSSFPPTNIDIPGPDGLQKVRVFGQVLDKNKIARKARLAQMDPNDPNRAAVEAAPTAAKRAKQYSQAYLKTVGQSVTTSYVDEIIKLLDPRGGGLKAFFDFDKTLAFNTDPITEQQKLSKGKIPPMDDKTSKAGMYAEFYEKASVARGLSDKVRAKMGLAKTKPSVLFNRLVNLSRQLKTKLSPADYNKFLSRLHIVTARPQSTVGSIASWVNSRGLNIPLSNFTGVGTRGAAAANIGIAKANVMAQALGQEKGVFVDDDPANIGAASQLSGIQSFLYKKTKSSMGRATRKGIADTQGNLFEEEIRQTLAKDQASANIWQAMSADIEKHNSIDFPYGIGSKIATAWFNNPLLANNPVDAKRTLTGPKGKIVSNIKNFLKNRQNFAIGGMVQRLMAGATVEGQQPDPDEIISRGMDKYKASDITRAMSELQGKQLSTKEAISLFMSRNAQGDFQFTNFGNPATSTKLPKWFGTYKAPPSAVQQAFLKANPTLDANFNDPRSYRRARASGRYRRYANGDVVAKYFESSKYLNAGLLKKGMLSRGGQGRKEQADRMKEMRKLETLAPEILYSSISRKAFESMALQTGLNKNPNIPEGTGYFDKEKYFGEEVMKIIGKSFRLSGYSSTSKDFGKAKIFLDNAPRSKDNWAAMMTITTKKGARGVDVVEKLKGKNVGGTKQGINPRTGKAETLYQRPPETEDEFILRPNSKFRINSAKFVKLGANKNLWMNVQQFAKGGEVPLVAQEGEYIINKYSAKAFGYNNLARINKYHSGGKVQKFARGGRLAPDDDINIIRRSGRQFRMDDTQDQWALRQREADIRRQWSEREQRRADRQTRIDARANARANITAMPEALTANPRIQPNRDDLRQARARELQKIKDDAAVTRGTVLTDEEARAERRASTRSNRGTRRQEATTSAQQREAVSIQARETERSTVASSIFSDRGARPSLDTAEQSREGRIAKSTRDNRIKQLRAEQSRLKNFRAALESDIKSGKPNLAKDQLDRINAQRVTAGKKVLTLDQALVKTQISQNRASENITKAKNTYRTSIVDIAKQDIQSGLRWDGEVQTTRADRAAMAANNRSSRRSSFSALGIQTQRLGLRVRSAAVNSGILQPNQQDIQNRAAADQARKTATAQARKQQLIDAGFGRGGARTQDILVGRAAANTPLTGLTPAQVTANMAARRAGSQASQNLQQLRTQQTTPPPSGFFGSFFGGRNNPPNNPPRGPGNRGGGGQGANAGANNQNDPNRGMNRAMTLSFMIPMLTDMITSGTPTTASGAYNQTLTQGIGTTAGSSMMMGQMVGEMFGGTAGAIAGLGTAAIGVAKAMADAENAAREFAITSATTNLETSTERAAKSLELFSKDVKNAALESRAARDIIASTAAADRLQSAKKTTRRGLMNFFDTGEGSAERSDILFDRGMNDYLLTAPSVRFGRTPERMAAMQQAQSSMYATMIPAKSAEAAKAYGSTAELSTRFLEEKFKSGSTVESMFGSREFDQLTRSLALADAAIQEQIMLIQNSADLTAEEKNSRIASIISIEGENKARKVQADTLKQMKLEEFNRSTSHLQNSLERMFQNMEQAIGRNVYELDRLSQQAELSAAALSGNAKAGQVSLRSINVLQNPRAYNRAERASATQSAANMFGSEADTMRGLLQAGGTLEDTIMSTINKTIKEDSAAGNEKIGIRLQSNISQALEKLKLPPDIAKKLGQEVDSAIGQIRKKGDEKIDFGDLMEKIPQLGKVMDSTRRAQEAAIKALEHWQSNLNDYSNAMNQMVESTVEANSRFRRASDIQVRGQMELDKALGREISLRQQLDASLAGVKAQTGGETNPALIAQNIRSLETQRASQQSMSNTAGARGYGGGDEFMMMQDRLRNTNVALRENYDALKSMADNTEMASMAMAKINEIQQKRQAGVNMAERLVTSSPQELSNLNRAMDRLNNNMQGGINFGSTADQRKESLDAFNMIAPFLGEKQNAMKANVLESMLIESGVGVNTMMGEVLQSLRNPEGDPEMQAAIAEYKKAVDLQTIANRELGTISMLMSQNTADIAAQKLVAAMKGVPFTFENSQLTDIANEIRNLRTVVENKPGAMAAAGKSMGGIIYAAAGQMIDFQPKGTDTVPAMLTPGEFVVNRSATQKHLPLLNKINSGGYSKGGSVKYYEDGGYVVTGGFAPKQGAEAEKSAKESFDRTSTKELVSNYEYPIINNNKGFAPFGGDLRFFKYYYPLKGRFYATTDSPNPVLAAGEGFAAPGNNLKFQSTDIAVNPTLGLGYDSIIYDKAKPGMPPTPKYPSFYGDTIQGNLFGGLPDIDNFKSNFFDPTNIKYEKISKDKQSQNKTLYKTLLEYLAEYEMTGDTVTNKQTGDKTHLKTPASLSSLSARIVNTSTNWGVEGLTAMDDLLYFLVDSDTIDNLNRQGTNPGNIIGPSLFDGQAKISSGSENLKSFVAGGLFGATINYGPTLGSYVKNFEGHTSKIQQAHAKVREQIQLQNDTRKSILIALENISKDKFTEESKEALQNKQNISDLVNLYNGTVASVKLDKPIVEPSAMAGSPLAPITAYNEAISNKWTEYQAKLFELNKKKQENGEQTFQYSDDNVDLFGINKDGNQKAFRWTDANFGIEDYNTIFGEAAVSPDIVQQPVITSTGYYDKNGIKFSYIKYDPKSRLYLETERRFGKSFEELGVKPHVIIPAQKNNDEAIKPFNPFAFIDSNILASPEHKLDDYINWILAHNNGRSFSFPIPNLSSSNGIPYSPIYDENSDASGISVFHGSFDLKEFFKAREANMEKVKNEQALSYAKTDFMIGDYAKVNEAKRITVARAIYAAALNSAPDSVKGVLGGEIKSIADIGNKAIAIGSKLPKNSLPGDYERERIDAWRAMFAEAYNDTTKDLKNFQNFGFNLADNTFTTPIKQENILGNPDKTRTLYWDNWTGASNDLINAIVNRQIMSRMTAETSTEYLSPDEDKLTGDSYAFGEKGKGTIQSAEEATPDSWNKVREIALDPQRIFASSADRWNLLTSLKDFYSQGKNKYGGDLLPEPLKTEKTNRLHKLMQYFGYFDSLVNTSMKTGEAPPIGDPSRKFPQPAIPWAAGVPWPRYEYFEDALKAISDPEGKTEWNKFSQEKQPFLNLETGRDTLNANQVEALIRASANLKEEDQKKKDQNNQGAGNQFSGTQNFATGGMVYASKGTLVNYQPRGTDTVPAMLTPGEFVINRKATQKHLPVLKAINDGYYTRGGIVNYLSNGGVIVPNYYADPTSPVSGNNKMFDLSSYMGNIFGQIGSSITLAFQNAVQAMSGQNAAASSNGVSSIDSDTLNKIGEFTNRLKSVADTLAGLSAIPQEITITVTHTHNVIINGDSALNKLSPDLQEIAMSALQEKFAELAAANQIPGAPIVDPFRGPLA